MLTAEKQLCIIRAFSDVEKPDLAVKAAKSENKKRLYNVKEGSD